MKSRGLTTLGADSLLLAAAIIWGTGFVAQNLGSKHLSAFAFTGLRFTAGTLLLLPLLAFAPWPTHIDRATSRRATLRGGLFGLIMLCAANVQQFGLASTTASNGAFITSLYVVFVPFIGLFAKQNSVGQSGVALCSLPSGSHCSASNQVSPLTRVIRGYCCARCFGRFMWRSLANTRVMPSRFACHSFNSA